MLKYIYKLVFLIMLITGSLISISSNSWLGVWMGLEINLISFIPLIVNPINIINSEASLNYFLVQAFASSLILFFILINLMTINLNFEFMGGGILLNFVGEINSRYNYIFSLIVIILMIKLGAAPFHFWFPNVSENIDWLNNLILMTWQKLAPFFIISYFSFQFGENYLMLGGSLCSTLVGALGGLNQLSLRKIIAFSSINHMGWIMLSIMLRTLIWIIYFFIYSLLVLRVIFYFKMFSIYFLNQIYTSFRHSSLIKLLILAVFLSLGGLPPFLGFLPKWLIIQELTRVGMNLMVIFIIIIRLITLYYYLKIRISAYLVNVTMSNWLTVRSITNVSINICNLMAFISLFSFFVFTRFIDLLF